MRFDRPHREGMTFDEEVSRAALGQERADIEPPKFPALDETIFPEDCDYPHRVESPRKLQTSRSSSLKRKASESDDELESPKKKTKTQLFHKKKDIKPTRILLRINSSVHEFDTAMSKWIKLECDWSSMSGFDPNQHTEPFPLYREPTAEEIAAWADGVISAAGSNELDGFNVVPPESKSEEIINVKPKNQKPSFRFEPSSIASRFPGFLAEMKAANEELAAGDPEQHNIELPECDTTSEYIEMNLGLGVLEELHEDPESLVKLEEKS
jgi:hypothetical protein